MPFKPTPSKLNDIWGQFSQEGNGVTFWNLAFTGDKGLLLLSLQKLVEKHRAGYFPSPFPPGRWQDKALVADSAFLDSEMYRACGECWRLAFFSWEHPATKEVGKAGRQRWQSAVSKVWGSSIQRARLYTSLWVPTHFRLLGVQGSHVTFPLIKKTLKNEKMEPQSRRLCWLLHPCLLLQGC